MWEAAEKIVIGRRDKEELERLALSPKTAQKMVKRSKIVLKAGEGQSNNRIAEELGVSRSTVIHWRARYIAQGLEGLKDASRPSGKPALASAKVKAIVEATQFKKPKNATQWTTRSMAKIFGVSHMMVRRIWKEYNLQPHRTSTFKISQDAEFVAKVKDIVGLYLNPPDRALVLCVDEKSQIQALDRSQPLLPMRPGQIERHTHDYVRHGTINLFAALDIASGTVVAECYQRHRHQEFLAFLKKIDQETPADLDLHLVMDNYCTHKNKRVRAWLARHPRFHIHYTPTSASWLNQIELWFSILTRKRIRRGVFRSLRDLINAIRNYVAGNNINPQPFTWTKSAKHIINRSPHCIDTLVTVD